MTSRVPGATSGPPPSLFTNGPESKKRIEMVCSAPLQQGPYQPVRTYISHHLFSAAGVLVWPQHTDIWCLHCCHGFSGVPVPLPYDYSEERNEYSVSYGVFCSFSCAKGYAIEHPSHNSPNQMLYLQQLARNFYGITGPITPAPPRSRLKVFGGDLDIVEFRRLSGNEVITVVHQPPMISWAMVYEERRHAPQEANNETGVIVPVPVVPMAVEPQERWELRGLRVPDEPQKMELTTDDMYPSAPGLYDAFLVRETGNAADPTSKKPAEQTPKVSQKPKANAMKTIIPKSRKVTAKSDPEAVSEPVDKRGTLKAFIKRRMKET